MHHARYTQPVSTHALLRCVLPMPIWNLSVRQTTSSPGQKEEYRLHSRGCARSASVQLDRRAWIAVGPNSRRQRFLREAQQLMLARTHRCCVGVDGTEPPVLSVLSAMYSNSRLDRRVTPQTTGGNLLDPAALHRSPRKSQNKGSAACGRPIFKAQRGENHSTAALGISLLMAGFLGGDHVKTSAFEGAPSSNSPPASL